MTFLIAAAGTGGHVYPGLAVGEALVDRGISREDVTYVGGDRLEAEVYPGEGFPFLSVELRGLQRSFTTRNLGIPRVVLKAKAEIAKTIGERHVAAVLGMGGYVTVPAALAARQTAIPLLIAEQNAGAGLANRIASRWASRCFVSFPATHGLAGGEWVGNPVRKSLIGVDRIQARGRGLHHYGLDPALPILGVFGGSLGAGAINEAITGMAREWSGNPIQILHLTGRAQYEAIRSETPARGVTWNRIAFEETMEMFYSVSDLIVARAGGAVSELAVTGSPSILIPGEFGSSGHQPANAAFFEESGAAVVVRETDLSTLTDVVSKVLFDDERLARMADAASAIARPEAAKMIATALIEAAT